MDKFGIKSVGAFLENPFMVEDIRLREDLLSCIMQDRSYAPDAEQLKDCCGKEYEDLLESNLKRLNFCFQTEGNSNIYSKK